MRFLFWSFYDPLGQGGFEKQAVLTLRLLEQQGHSIGCLAAALPGKVESLENGLSSLRIFNLGVVVLPAEPPKRSLLTQAGFWLRPHPSRLLAGLVPGFAVSFQTELRRRLRDWSIDAIYVLSMRSLYFMPEDLPLPVLADLVDCYSLKYRRRIQFEANHAILRLPLAIADWLKTRRIEKDLACRFQSTTDFLFVSRRDAAEFSCLAPREVQTQVIALPIEEPPCQSKPPTAEEHLLVFYGHLYTEFNFDATRTLIQGVLPLIRKRVPAARVELTGIGAPAGIKNLIARFPWVTFVPQVADLRAFVCRTAVICWPFRYGSGIKTKILESMLFGMAVVTTSRGAEPFNEEQRQSLTIADTPEEMAAAVLRLWNASEERGRLGKLAREIVRRDFTGDFKARALVELAAQRNDRLSFPPQTLRMHLP